MKDEVHPRDGGCEAERLKQRGNSFPIGSPLGFQNCTKTAKYEALEKNVVSDRKLPSLR